MFTPDHPNEGENTNFRVCNDCWQGVNLWTSHFLSSASDVSLRSWNSQKKPWKRKKKKEWRFLTNLLSCWWSPEFKWNPCVGWEDFVMSRLSLHPEPNPTWFCALSCTKMLWGPVLALKSLKAKQTGLTGSQKNLQKNEEWEGVRQFY